MSNGPDGMAEARRRIAEEAKRRTGRLDLRGLDLRALPGEIAGLTSLQTLDCAGTQVADLAPIAGLAKLQTLECWSTQVADLAPLAGLANLQTLFCWNTQVADLASLAGLANLQTLNCWDTRVADLAPLAGLDKLQTLFCSDTQVADLAPLAGLGSLQTLHCSDTQVADLAPVAGLANLQMFDCSATPVADLAPLARLANLQTLNCSSTRVADLAPLARLANLQTLFCSSTRVADLAPLASLANLQTLFCSDTQVADLAPLASLANLQTLFCSHTQIADLAPLAGLAKLQTLVCGGTQVADLAPLLALTAFGRLDCRQSKVKRLPEEIWRLRALSDLDLRNNGLTRLPASLGQLRGLEADPRPADDLVKGGGLHLEGNPLAPPLPALIAPGQPEATRNVLAWLRGELDPAKVAGLVAAYAPALPPDMPNPGAGLHLEVGASGAIVFAPPEALDAEGNHVARLRSLHPELCAALDDLLAALGGATLGGRNAPQGPLAEAATAYAAIATAPLEAMDFDRLYARGVRLRAAAAETEKAIERGVEPALPVKAAAALRTVLDLHGPFIRATKAGIELSADEEADAGTPEDRREQREAAIALAEQMQDQPGLVAPEVAQEVLAAAQASGEGPNPARSSVIASAQVRHVTTAVLSMGAAAGAAAGAFAVAGPGASVIVALLAIEPIKNSRGYAHVRDFLTRALNRPGDADPAAVLDALRRHQDFVRRQAPRFERLGALGGRWAFISGVVAWIKRSPPPKD
ncbi:leucine-rich repeat domain-containing protein [Roseomonas sp. AR75]|uniref:leucine-rich repeat domain-containing protein n=1 Tax=Roseomonas sp. AR75 TaxID=2562311 RepID=UPI001484E5E5|nr:leucine-rich repeat domain-containing protein [Roseomonas sp. AR75]